MPDEIKKSAKAKTVQGAILEKLLAEFSKCGTGLTFLQEGNTILFKLELDAECYTTKPKSTTRSDGKIVTRGGGNTMVATSHGNQVFVNENGEEVKIGINAYRKPSRV